MSDFVRDIANAKLSGQKEPEIVADINVVEYYNAGMMESFYKAGYFVYDGVKVMERGVKKAEEKK